MSQIVCIESDWAYVNYNTLTRRFLPFNLPPHGWGQRGVYPIPRKVYGPDGKQRCRWCLGPIKPPRRTWCSDECVREGALRRNWGYLSDQIAKRDRVCRLCGRANWTPTCWRRGYGRDRRRECPVQDIEMLEPDRYPMSHLYCPIQAKLEVDHIVAVSEGGTDDPENLRLLCVPCHWQVTREQHARWAAKRRPQLTLLEETDVT